MLLSEVLGRICRVQIQTRKHALDNGVGSDNYTRHYNKVVGDSYRNQQLAESHSQPH